MAIVTVKPIGGDYTTLAAAVAGANAGDTIEVYITSEELASTLTIDKTLTIKGVDTGRTDGSPGSGFVLSRSSGNVITYTPGAGDSLTLDGFEIQQAGTGTSDEGMRYTASGANTLTMTNMVVYGPQSVGASQQDFIYYTASHNATIDIINSKFFSWGRSVLGFSGVSGTITININSSSFYDIGGFAEARAGIIGSSNDGATTIDANIFNSLLHVSGFNREGDRVIYNSAARGTIVVDRSITNESQIDNTNTQTDVLVNHNWTDDDTKTSDGDWIIAEDITTFPFDLRLASNDFNVAQDLHADDTGAGLIMPSTDIAGTSRPQNTNYDVGAFEIVAGGTDVNVIPTTELLQITTPQVEVFQDIDVFPVTETFAIATPAVDVQVSSDITVNPLTELLQITTPQVTVQYFPFVNVDVQTETLLISTPPVNVEVFEDTTVIPATQFLNIITPPIDVNVGFDVDVNPLTEFLDIATPQVDVKTPVEFLIATEAQPLQYQVAVGGIVQMRAQLNVNAWRNENNWVSTPFPAIISTQPVGGSVTPGGAVSLSVTAIGAASYQWYLDGAALIGETGSTLNTTAPVIPGDYDYTCLALNADGFGIRSDAATVTVPTAS